MAPYHTSKHAVIGLMRCAALEGGKHGIRVNTVNPGPIETRMMRSIENQYRPAKPRSGKPGRCARSRSATTAVRSTWPG